MRSIKQVVQEDRLNRRRNKTQSRVIASSSSDDSAFQSLDESGMSYKNRVDSGKPRRIISIVLYLFNYWLLCFYRHLQSNGGRK